LAISDTVFYGAYVLFTQTTLSKVTESTYPSQWPGLILISSTTGLPDWKAIDASVLAVWLQYRYFMPHTH